MIWCIAACTPLYHVWQYAVCTSMYCYVRVCTSTNQCIVACTLLYHVMEQSILPLAICSMYQYVLVHTSMYQYIPVYCCMYSLVPCHVTIYLQWAIWCSMYSLPLQTGWSMFTEYVLLVTLHLQSHTCSASTRGLASPLAVPTQQRLMAGVAAMCMRSKLGSGCLGAASSAWVVSLWRRLLWRKALCAWNKPSVQQRLVGAGATSKWSVCVVDVYTCMYQYVPVRTNLYLHYLNFAFFEIRRHPIISLA